MVGVARCASPRMSGACNRAVEPLVPSSASGGAVSIAGTSPTKRLSTVSSAAWRSPARVAQTLRCGEASASMWEGELLADALYCLRFPYGIKLDGSPPCVSTWLLQGRYIECAAPQPLAPLTSSNMTVLLRLLLLSPVAAPGDQWRGIGYPAINIHDNMAVTVVDVTSVYDIDLVVGSNSSTSSTRRLRRAAVASGDWRPMVYGDKFMFTYTVNGERCGCDVDSTSTCDGCGRYRPTPWLPNLAI